MSERFTVLLADFLLVACAVIAMIVVIPAASASSNKIRPGWRAWVWPLVFLSLALSTFCSAFSSLQRFSVPNPLIQLAGLLLGLTLHWIILSAVYRIVNKTGSTIAPFVWLGYGIFTAIFLLTNNFVAVTVYELICAIIVGVVYISVFARDRDLAADALPILIGLALNVLGAFVNSFSFSFTLVVVPLNNEIIFHLMQAIGVIYFMRGSNISYSVKYAAQRRLERERELLSTKN